jgi:hypothetical protein
MRRSTPHEVVETDVRSGGGRHGSLRDGDGGRLLLLLGVFLRRRLREWRQRLAIGFDQRIDLLLSTRVSRCR